MADKNSNEIGKPEIKNFVEFLEPHLDGSKIIDFETRYLTAVGDNYGSTMLGVTVTTQDVNNCTKTLELVAKMVPTNQQMREMFKSELTFIKENAIYTNIGPTLIEFQKDMNVPDTEIFDCLAKCYGARISLDSDSKEVDSDALLVLENLVVKGYTVGNRTIGFDAEHTFVILKDLAKFHATPMALKYLRPNEFEEKIKPYLNRIDVDSGMPEDIQNKMIDTLLRDVMHVEEINHLSEKIKKQIFDCLKMQADSVSSNETTPYHTIVHNDFWVNNMMIGYDSKGHPKDMKLIDFQLTMYASFVHDLIFFLFSSVEDDVLKDKFDEFIKYYYDEFYKCLKISGCPLDDFTYERFLCECNKRAIDEFFHIIIMLRVFFAKKENMPETHDDINNDMFMSDDLVGPEYYVKLKNFIIEFEKRKWL